MKMCEEPLLKGIYDAHMAMWFGRTYLRWYFKDAYADTLQLKSYFKSFQELVNVKSNYVNVLVLLYILNG